MTRWHIIKVLLIVAYRVVVKRDYIGLLLGLLPKEDPPATEPMKHHRSAMGFVPELRKMVRGGGQHLIVVLLLAGVAMAAGQITVTGYPPVPVTIKGGTGINITGGVITATGTAVVEGSIPFTNISSAGNAAYLAKTGTAINSLAYQGNSAPSATEFSYIDGVTAPIQGQISSVKVTAESKPNASNVTPTMNGIAAAGSAPTVSRADHTHPSDTSREPANANIQSHISSTGNPHIVTKVQVGLGNVDNTSDLSKPISTATQAALNLKANTSSLATVATTGSYTDLLNKPATYSLPTASTTVLGGVKVDGTSVVIDGAGVISSTVSAGVSSVDGSTGAVSLTGVYKSIAAFNNFSTQQAAQDAAQDAAIAGKEPADATIIKESELSSATNSASTTTAANSAAVKAAYDLAAGKLSPTGDGSGLTGITAAQVGAATTAQGAKADTALQPENYQDIGLREEIEPMVFTSAGVYRTLSATSIAHVVSVTSRHPYGTRYIHASPDVTLTEGVDYYVNLATGEIRLNANTITSQFIYGYNWNQSLQLADDNMITNSNWLKNRDYTLWVRYLTKEPKPTVAKVGDIPAWLDKVKNSTTFTTVSFGDSTSRNDIDQTPQGWWAKLFAEEVHRQWPNNTSDLHYQCAVGGTNTTSVDTNVEITTRLQNSITADGVVVDISNTATHPVDLVFISWGMNETDATTTLNNIRFMISDLRSRPGWSNVEIVLVSELRPMTDSTNWRYYDSTHQTMFNAIRAGMATIAGDTAGVTYVDTTALWDRYLARKTAHDMLHNDYNHANQWSARIYMDALQAIIPSPAPRSEIASTTNVGTGDGQVYKQKIENVFQLKTIKAGANITVTNNTDDITISSTAGGTGDVTGPASSVDNAFARFDGATGKVIQNSVATLDDTGAAAFGAVGIGTGATATALHVRTNGTPSVTFVSERVSPDSVGGAFLIRKARGTLEAPAKVNSGDGGPFSFAMHNGTSYVTVAQMWGYADETPADGASHIKGSLRFWTDNGTALAERMRVDNSGNVGIGTTSPSAKLDVVGDVKASGTITAKLYAATIPAATTYGSTSTVDLSAGVRPSLTLTGNTTIAFSNPVIGSYYNLLVKQDATGSRTVTWPSTGLVCTWIKSDYSTTTTGPTMPTAANSVLTTVILPTSSTTADCWAAGH